MRVIRPEALDQLKQLRGIARMITSVPFSEQAVSNPPSKTLIAPHHQSAPVRGWELQSIQSTALPLCTVKNCIFCLIPWGNCTLHPATPPDLFTDVPVGKQLKYHNWIYRIVIFLRSQHSLLPVLFLPWQRKSDKANSWFQLSCSSSVPVSNQLEMLLCFQECFEKRNLSFSTSPYCCFIHRK